ncbi:hypothetical protein XELAEV_18007317mg [Xenopus laevis]|uniref:Uncharacterized protein n=1 Tax=Xenopus laevis TaxID=8355 RepID=A0A974I4W7_XENLA|nr:hypothetical protein XELAEV_18007317mg [Xenopus laevis]
MDEPIIVMCTPPQSYTVKGIRYYKEEKEIYVTNAPQTSYRVPRNASGNYTCGYWIEIEGRQILSYLSQNINVRRIVPASGFSTSLNPAQFVESDISQSSACSTPAGPLIATLTTSGVLPPSFTAPSTSRTTARLQSTPGTQSTATSQAPSTFRTTSHPQSTTGTQSSASPKGKKHHDKPKPNQFWTNNNSTGMESEISGKNSALLVMPALDQDTNDKLHVYCEIEITSNPLAHKKPTSSPKPKPAMPPTIPPSQYQVGSLLARVWGPPTGFPDRDLAESRPDLDRMGLKIPSDRGRICSLMRSRDPTARLANARIRSLGPRAHDRISPILPTSRWAYRREIRSFGDIAKRADLSVYGHLKVTSTPRPGLAHVKLAKQQAPHSDALLYSSVMEMNPLYACSPLK